MTANAKQVKITINGLELMVDESLTLLEAARQNEIHIPTLCHHPALSNWGGCRLCVVQVDQSPKLVASCVMPVRNGMEVITDNEAITASRRMTLELLFAERNHNCMFCPQSGACELQQAAYSLQMDHLTVAPSFDPFPVDTGGEFMTFDHNRCILCGRCVRACQEIDGSYVLGFHNRGPKSLIGFDLLESRRNSACLNCGVCLQVCPTGAISSRYRTHYAVMGQPAEQSAIESVCAGCGLLCPTRSVVRDTQLIRVEGILGMTDSRPDRGQLCAKGRFEVLKTLGQRLTAPMLKDADGHWRECSWEAAYAGVRQGVATNQSHQGAESSLGLVSSAVSNETLVLFRDLMVHGWRVGYLDTLDGPHFRNLTQATNPVEPALPIETSWKKLASADFVLAVGVDAFANHPLLTSLLRRASIEKAVPVAILGRTPWEPLSKDLCLAVENDALPGLVETLAHRAGGITRSVAAEDLPIDQLNVLDRIAELYKAAQEPWIVVGDQLTATCKQNLIGALIDLATLKAVTAATGSLLTLLKPHANSMTAWQLGLASQRPFQGRGKLGLALLEAEQDRAVAALPACDFWVVITPFVSALLLEKADIVLPKTLWMEEDGSYSGLEIDRTIFKPKVLQAPLGVRSSWQILQELAKLSGQTVFPSTWEEIQRAGRKAVAVMRDASIP